MSFGLEVYDYNGSKVFESGDRVTLVLGVVEVPSNTKEYSLLVDWGSGERFAFINRSMYEYEWWKQPATVRIVGDHLVIKGGDIDSFVYYGVTI